MIPPARRSIADSSEPISVDFEGNKQGDTVKSDLGAAIQNSHSQVDIEVLADASKMHEDSIVSLKARKPVEMRARRNTAEKEQAANYYYASMRTNVSLTVCCARWSRNLRNPTFQILLVWTSTNVSPVTVQVADF